MKKVSNFSGILLMILPLLFVTTCKHDSETASKPESVAEKALASKAKPDTLRCVCIWDKVPLRAEPRRDGKWLSSLSLGETVTWFGETAIDSTDKNRQYLRIQLSDGKTGWASSYGLVKDSEVGAVKEATFLYQRPDLLTITDEMLESMDMVAVDEVNGDWIHVIGEKRKKRGWIKQDHVTTKRKDVAVAILATKKLREKSELSEFERIEQVLSELPYSDSYFIEKLKERIDGPEADEPMDGEEDIQTIMRDTSQSNVRKLSRKR